MENNKKEEDKEKRFLNVNIKKRTAQKEGMES